MILIIEDEPDIRESIAQSLELEGFPVASAANGREGLELLGRLEAAPCLILLDLMMPQMDGFEFLNALRAGPHGAVPTVILSAYNTPVPATGVENVIKKPVDLSVLIETARRHCDASHHTGSNRTEATTTA